jgi:hypothetical protein
MLHRRGLSPHGESQVAGLRSRVTEGEREASPVEISIEPGGQCSGKEKIPEAGVLGEEFRVPLSARNWGMSVDRNRQRQLGSSLPERPWRSQVTPQSAAPAGDLSLRGSQDRRYVRHPQR